MTPAPEAWKQWKRAPQAVAFVPQVATDRRFRSRTKSGVAAVTAALVVAALLWLLGSTRSNAEALTDRVNLASTNIACWLEAHAQPGSISRDRSDSCWR